MTPPVAVLQPRVQGALEPIMGVEDIGEQASLIRKFSKQNPGTDVQTAVSVGCFC